MSKTNMGNRESSPFWSPTYDKIKLKHDEAFRTIERAISLEEKGLPHQAIEDYKRGIQVIDEGLSIQVVCPESPDSTWQHACQMITKMKSARAEVLIRIDAILSSPEYEASDAPPSYEVAMSESSEGSLPVTYRELAEALRELSIDPNQNLDENIIYTHDGVRLYFINPNGEVTSAREPQTLTISRVLSENTGANVPKAMLQIGDWVYSLVPGVSPCYRTNYGAFILPDIHSNVKGSSVGIILPSEADSEVFDLLENILHGIISQSTAEEIHAERQRRELGGEEDFSSKISSKIVNGAWYISQGLVRGAQRTSELINYTTPKVINSITPASQPTNISPNVQKTMQVAETTTKQAVRVTGFIAEKVGVATMHLGQFLAPHIQKQGTRLLASGFNMPEQEASHKMQSVLTIAAGAVEGFSTVYRGLESSAEILGDNLKTNTVKIVQHKYGANAGEFAGDTLNTVGNVYAISRNAKIMTPKGLAKRTVKDAGKAIFTPVSNEAGPSSSSNQVVIEEMEQESDIIIKGGKTKE